MNTTNTPAGSSQTPWATTDDRMRAPDTSMLPGSEKAPPAATSLLKNAVRGAHNTIDRMADSAAPAVQHMGESLTAAEEALQEKAHQLRDTRDEWVGSVRTRVRSHPLTTLAAVFALGALVGRITR